MSEPQTPKIMAGEEAILARRYATALYDLAQDKKAIEAVAGDLAALKDAIYESPQFRVMATHPRLPQIALQKAMKNIVDTSKFHVLTSAFLMQVVRNRRLAYLTIIIEAFQADLAMRRGEYVAMVTVAKAMSKEQHDKLASQLGKMVSGSVRLVVEEDASLIGGVVVKLGTRLIDASVKGRLARLERQLKTQQEAA